MTQFIPDTKPGSGGTRFGHHYLKTFEDCPQLFFNQYVRPIERDGVKYRGISAKKTARPLLSGGLFHEGLAAWYLSGCRDGEDTGERDIEAALEVAKGFWEKIQGEYEGGPDGAEEDWIEISALLRQYHDHHGPDGASEYPDLRIAHDGAGVPLVERAFELSMGYPADNPYIYTVRVDAIIERCPGFRQIFEHKTSNYRWVSTRIKTIHTDAQFTGEFAALQALCPDDPLNGILVNVIAKGRGPRSSVALTTRETTTRSPGVMRAWRKTVVKTLIDIDEAVAGFDGVMAQGVDLEQAAEWYFPLRGTRTGHCWSYNRLCGFASLCERDNIKGELGEFKPRTASEKDAHREFTG